MNNTPLVRVRPLRNPGTSGAWPHRLWQAASQNIITTPLDDELKLEQLVESMIL
jgi:hypothetical protein